MPVFDVIGKRRWFFLISAIATIPGLIFILLGPITNGAAGLQFSIDYTGGTNWEIQFADPKVTGGQIKSALADQGVTDATVVGTSGGFFEIRSRQVALPAQAAPSPSRPKSRNLIWKKRFLSILKSQQLFAAP